MSDNEQFDLIQEIDEPRNLFKIVHIYNKRCKYHLTRQLLLDSVLTQKNYCFFYHILTKPIDQFNKLYSCIATLIDRNKYEADLYLNVDSDALDFIIQYIQTQNLNWTCNTNIITQTIDLASMFGMSNLVLHLRTIYRENTSSYIDTIFQQLPKYIAQQYENLSGSQLDTTTINKFIEDFFTAQRQPIIESIIYK